MSAARPTVERIHPEHFRTREKYLLYLRHVFAYEYVIGQLEGPCEVLEAGMGDGYGARMLAEAGHTVTAVDVDHATVAAAAARNSIDGCRFMHYDGKRLPFDDQSFDVVVSMQVIEHVQEDIAFADEMRRVLRAGGTCWLTTPNRSRRVAADSPVWNAFHVREYWPEQLRSVLSPVFDDVEIYGIAGRDDVQAIEQARVRRGMSLRKLVPHAVRARFDSASLGRYSTDVFHVTAASGSQDGIDLLAECRRMT